MVSLLSHWDLSMGGYCHATEYYGMLQLSTHSMHINYVSKRLRRCYMCLWMSWHARMLESESCHNANFVVIGVWCGHWRQSWYHINSRFSVFGWLSLSFFCPSPSLVHISLTNFHCYKKNRSQLYSPLVENITKQSNTYYLMVRMQNCHTMSSIA